MGLAVASQLLAARSADGANLTPPPYVPGTQPGDYQLTPPNFAPADFAQWPQVTPFALQQPDEFRPGPPPALTSAVYTRVFNEVKSLGFITSTTRTAEQTEIGKFLNGNIQDFWNKIAQTAALDRHLNLEQSARLFALLNISLADTAIAFFDASTPTTFGVRSLRFNSQALMEIRTPSLIQPGFHYPRRPLQTLPTPEHTARSVRRARPC